MFKELFKEEINEVSKSSLYMDFKVKERPGYKFKAVFSKINKMTRQRELETLWFKSKMDALGHSDKYNKEMESGKLYEKTETPEELLRKADIKIKLVTPTAFGTQFDLAKKYDEEEIKEILKDFDIKIKNKSVFIIE
jgi:hypothetical protein